ncbi:tripartite tricarboxylate transporter substrate binding protein [Pusillimonas sp. ANT_WB101]|uniref:Bug family tripartite tricarboxylate transporter substrate binding protein n=1 Tax=Pusillimonas sp. ANT_WB101 TaxID=2597356 RepID=UPI0011F05CC0|nr:tripartite tricarboxylate transporter substrate binding protein [Pusillimonas sp. ANT_WB101]KAA0889303.1 tripartite tricarboxylate transporter substrate binding protein [Pusillimonas sp. ANT_WB101]
MYSKKLLGITLATTMVFGLASNAAISAEAFPSRPVKFVVQFSPGGATDTLARMIADKLTAPLGVPVLVENKPGAGGIIALDTAVRAGDGGHTLTLISGSALMTNEFLHKKLPYDRERDLSMVYQVVEAPLALVVVPSVTANTAPELLDYVSANKGKISYGSYGIGSYPHLMGSHMSQEQDADMTHIPYKGESDVMLGLLRGEIQMQYSSALLAKPHIESGKIKAIGVSSRKRMPALPEVPTLMEQGLEDETYQISGWLGFVTSSNAPQEAVDRMAKEIHAVMQLPEVQKRASEMGYVPITNSSPDVFNAVVKTETPIWKRLIEQSGSAM